MEEKEGKEYRDDGEPCECLFCPYTVDNYDDLTTHMETLHEEEFKEMLREWCEETQELEDNIERLWYW